MWIRFARHRLPAALALAIWAAVSMACGMESPSGPTLGDGDPTGPDTRTIYSAELAFCVDEINRYRAAVGLSALIRSEALEIFAARSAQHDAHVRVAHAYFRAMNGGGIAVAETEILWWRGASVRQVIEKGLAQMWEVGPGGEHYDVLVGPYREVGCGVYVKSGEVTVTQEFR